MIAIPNIRRTVSSLLGLLPLLFFLVGTVSAHSFDNYQFITYISLTQDAIVIDVNVSMGVLIAPQILASIDTDANTEISQAEADVYAQTLASALHLSTNDTPIALTLNQIEMPPYLDLNAGTGVIRLHLTAPLPDTQAGDYSIFYENAYGIEGINNTYMVNGFLPKAERDRFDITLQQRDYYQQTILLNYTILSEATPTASTTTTPESLTLQEQVISLLHETDLSPQLIVVMLGIALGLGGLHALTPGHGKALIAAYLIGSRGTVKHAVWLGSLITITHTASVMAIGFLALFASQYIVPEILIPALEITAGLLVVFIGLRLVITRWTSLKQNTRLEHPHLHRVPDRIRFSDLLAMGISGGIVPCPEALGILLVAVGLNRVGLGLGLIFGFSLGLALVLIGLGVIMVRFKPIVMRYTPKNSRWQRLVPFFSAVLVTVLGLGLVTSALASTTIDSQTIVTIVVTVVSLVMLVEVGTRLLNKPALVVQPSNALAFSGNLIDPSFLPPRYRSGKPISNAPMGAASLKFGTDGLVAWDEMWTDFCDLALAGGPPHRGKLLEPVNPSRIEENPDAYQTVVAEITRGLRLVTGLETVANPSFGWVGLVCTDEAMAIWMLRAILVENVSVRREDKTLFFPAGPDFRLDSEIKNVVTVVAKTHHYWVEHRDGIGGF